MRKATAFVAFRAGSGAATSSALCSSAAPTLRSAATLTGRRTAFATVARTTKTKYVLPEDGLLLYSSNRRGEFLVQAGVAAISCMAYGTYALVQYEAKQLTGEFAASSAIFAKITLGLGAVCVVTVPLFSWLSTRRAVRRMWAIPSTRNTNVASSLRIETHSILGGPGKTVDIHISEISPVGKLNPTDRFIRFQQADSRQFYLMTRNRAEFTNEQALQRLLNNIPVVFS